MKKIQWFLLVLLLLSGTLFRLNLFEKVGRDSNTYKRAVRELLNGENPYEYTIHTFEKEKQDWDHGFSYFPAMLYVIAPFYVLGELADINPAILWKIPVLLADLAIAYLLFRKLKDSNTLFSILLPALWLFNPYILLKSNYTYLDPLPILFMLLALIYLEKDDVLTGAFFAFSVLLKTFPIILLPLLFLKSKNKRNFILSGFITTLLVFIPFMNSFERFRSAILGSFFVHGDRVLQGRPFLYFLSFVTSIELLRVISTKTYSILAMLGAFIVSTFGALRPNLNKYLVSTLSFATFYLFTPVLNRTYLLWFMPIFLLGMVKTFKPKIAFAIIASFVLFYAWYLYIWIDGFHITPLA